jgi:drug/metabolite transporter (DMT)-like permease
MTKKLSKRYTSYLFLLINTLTWGVALIVVKPSLEFTTPFRYLLYRYIIAAFFSIPLLLYYWPKIKKKVSVIKKIIVVEFFGTALALTLLYIGLTKTTAIEASFLTTTTPIFVVLAGILYLKEKQEKHEWLGLFIAFFGTTLLTFLPVILNGMTPKGLSLEGNILIIMQNVATAIAMVLAKKHYKKLPKLFVTSISFYFGIVVFGILSLGEIIFSGVNITSAVPQLLSAVSSDLTQPSVLLAAGYMAIFGSIIGLTAYIKGQDGIEASEASLFWYLQPLVFVPAGLIFLQETIHPLQILAMITIFAGVYIAERRTKKRKR